MTPSCYVSLQLWKTSTAELMLFGVYQRLVVGWGVTDLFRSAKPRILLQKLAKFGFGSKRKSRCTVRCCRCFSTALGMDAWLLC